MPEVELSAGTIAYEDTGPPDAPAVVLLHGLLMDGSLWREVVPALRAGHRCVLPTLPLGDGAAAHVRQAGARRVGGRRPRHAARPRPIGSFLAEA